MENKRTETNKTVQKRLEPELKLINMDTVEVEQIEWLLYPFIPYGKVTIIQGDPGEGKTTMVLQIIAKLTRGETILPADSTKDKRIDIDSESDMVDAENIENNASTQHLEAPVNVIYQTAEDGLSCNFRYFTFSKIRKNLFLNNIFFCKPGTLLQRRSDIFFIHSAKAFHCHIHACFLL